MKPNRVRVHAQLIGDAGDAARLGRGAQQLQDDVSAPRGAHPRLMRARIDGHQSPCGANAATIGVSASTAPSFAAPPGDPRGSACPGRVSVKNLTFSSI